MAKAGLSFGSVPLKAMDINPVGNPYDPQPDIGLGNLNTTLADTAALGETMLQDSQFEMPKMTRPQSTGPQVLYSPSTNKMFVNGALYDADDAQSALDTVSFVTKPRQQAPEGYDWQPVEPQVFDDYIKNINDPSWGTLMARNFEIGGSNLKLLGGRGLQFLGAEETGQKYVNDAISELYYNQPYQREFTNIEFGSDESHGAIDWFVANFAQQGPMLIESVITTLIGVGAGAAAGGGANPFTAVGGGVAAMMGKESFKQSVLAAAKKYMKGEALTNGERKLLREVAGLTAASQIKNPKAFIVNPAGQAVLKRNTAAIRSQIDDAILTGAKTASKGGRNQALIGGGFMGNLGGSYALGVADIYGEVRDTGVGDRGTALLGALPYAALETLPEFFLAGRILGVPSSKLSPAGMARGGLAARAGKGFGVGAVLEGLTEAGQETILLGSTDQLNLSSPEVINRLINSFAAGAAVGGPIGGVANLKKGEATNLLDRDKDPEPKVGTTEVKPENPTPSPLEGEVAGQLPAPPSVAALPAPSGTQQEMFSAAEMGQTTQAPAAQTSNTVEQAVTSQAQSVANEQQDGSNNTVEQALNNQTVVVDNQGQAVPTSNQALEDQITGQQQLPLEDPTIAAVKQTAQQPETQQTAMGQQMLQAATIREEQLKRESEQARIEAEQARQEAELERTRAERQRQFDEALRLRQEQQIKELETARIEQILAENERLAEENAQLKMPMVTTQRQPVQPSLPGFAVPYGLRRLRNRQTQTTQPVAEMQQPTAAELEQAGQLPLPFDEPAAPAAANLRRGEDAVQERSTEEVAPSEQARGSQAIRTRDAQQQETTTTSRKAERLRKAPKGEVASQEAITDEVVKRADEPVPQPTNIAQQERQQDRRPVSQEEPAAVATAYDSPAEAWEDMGVTDIPLDDLPNEQRQEFERLVASGSVTYEQTEKIYNTARGQMDLTPLQELQEAIGFFDTATDATTFDYAAETILDFAFFNTDSNFSKKTAGGQPSIRDRALAYINNTQFSEKQQLAIDKAFVAGANLTDNLTGTYRGKEKPWVSYAAQRDLLDQITAPMRAMPKWYKAKQEEVVAEPVAQETQQEVQEAAIIEETPEQVQFAASQELEKQIDLQIRDMAINQIKRKNSKEITKLNNLFAKADPEFRMARGPKLKEYFDESGSLKLVNSGEGRLVPTTKTFTQEQLKERASTIRAARLKAAEREREQLEQLRMAEEQTIDNRSLSDEQLFGSYDDSEGNFYRADGTPITNPVPKGKIDLIVKQVLKKLKVKPTVTVVQNVAELRQSNPELYNRAMKSRPDFETTPAVGFSVGDQVIIFADYAKTEQSVRFVVAHEVLGHFGFRAFMPDNRLNAILRDIYKTDGHVRAVADRKMEAGMSLQEAVEEALADGAAYIDTHVMARFWAAVKNFLNRIGINFQDDLARYLISQSRRNLRTGGGFFVSGRQLSKNLERLSQDSLYGRFSLENDRADLASVLFSQFGMNKKAGPYGSFEGFRNLVNRGKAVDSANAAGNWFGEVLEKIQTLDNVATRNEGLSEIFKIFQSQSARVKRLHAEYEKLTAFSHTPNWFGQGKGPTTEELNQAGELLAYAALYKGKSTTEQMIRDMPNLMEIDVNGKLVPNINAIEQVIAAGELTREDFANGIPYTLDLIDGQENSQPATYTPAFEVTDNIWRIYTEQRAAVNQAALDVLEANLGASLEQRNEALEAFKNTVGKSGNAPTSVEIQTLRRVIEEYSNLYKEGAVQEGAGLRYKEDSVKKAQTFIAAINRAMHNTAKLNDWKTGKDNTADFQGERFQDIIDGLERLNALGLEEKQAYDITNAIQNIYILDVKNVNAEFLAKRTIMGAYVPFTRRGKFQVMVKAFDASGRNVDLDETYRSSMPYFQVGSRAEAKEIQTQLDTDFGTTQYTVLNRDGNEVQVTFRAEFGTARQAPALTHTVNLGEFVDVLTRLNINVTPQERERIVTALTKQGERARRSLQRSGVAGWDTDVIRSVSEYLETQGHMAGKTYYRHKLNRIMLDTNMWKGNVQKLQRLEEAMLRAERGGNEAQIKTARQEYDAYATMYQYSADVGANKTVNLYGASETVTGRLNPTRTVKKVKTEGRGEYYRDEAKRTLAWFSEAANIDSSTEDILSGEVGSRLKLIAVLFQLGGSVATAIINMMSMATHAVPYLATYNPKRGYGGGFGFSASGAAMVRAASNMKNGNLMNFEYVNEVANGENAQTLQDKHGLTQDEADALFEATGQGVLQAAQFNALVGTARGGVNSNQTASAIKGWMYMFSYTEQLNRRTTYLAAYRLERERQLASGATQQDAQDRAREFGRKAVNTSQGEYAMYNRPEMARGNVAQYIFIYKQFVIISVELMKGMNYKGRLYFLGMLLLFSGVKGLPFADDLMDLVDTLAQMFGIKMASVEKEIAQLSDALIPGSTPYVMRGLLDRFTGATISTRLGFGDLIPLSGALKQGADPWREVENFFGPVYNALQEGVATTGKLASYGAEVVGLKDDTTNFADILRDAPISAVRGLADGLTYLDDGRITNSRGNVISNDVPISTAIFRMLGFYPSVATQQNDLVRINKFTDAYVKSMKLKYTQAYVKAKLDNNISEVNRIIQFVNEHNRSHKGTEFEFRGFVRSANRAYNAAKRPTLLRYKKFAPKNIRQEVDDLMTIYGIDPEDLN